MRDKISSSGRLGWELIWKDGWFAGPVTAMRAVMSVVVVSATATIRLFGDSGVGDKGMPFYTVICGSEGKHRVVAKERMPGPPRKVLL